MQEKRRINFEELRPIIQTGHQWRVRRFLKSAFGVFGAYGSGSFVASGISAIAVAGGVAAGVAVAAILPAVIIPVAVLSISVMAYNQYKIKKLQESRYDKIFGTANALGKFQDQLEYFIKEGIWVNGLYELLDNFDGLTIEEKLQNIFGDRYEKIKNKETFISRYEAEKEESENREDMLSTFFDGNNRELNLQDEEDKQLAQALQRQVKQLSSDQYEHLSPKISTFKEKNPALKLKRGISLKQTTYNSERSVKNWRYYLEHGGKTVFTALIGAAAGFGFVAGIGAIAGVAAVSSTGVGLGVLIGAIVVAVVIAVVAVAVKAYVDDKEDDILDALKDAGEACDTLSHELLLAKDKIQGKEKYYQIGQENEDEQVLKRAIGEEGSAKKSKTVVLKSKEKLLIQPKPSRFSIKNFFTRRSSRELEESQGLRPDKKQ